MTRLSLWWDTLPPDLAAPLDTSEGHGASVEAPVDASVDVAIVGAGYTGLWTAYYLQAVDPLLRIAIVEAEQAGFGASGRNGGWASALFPVSLAALARASSREAAIRQHRAMIDALDELDRVRQAEGWAIDWKRGGTVVAARTPVQLQTLTSEVADARSWGFGEADIRLLTARETQDRVKATDVLGGTYTPHCASIHPARLVRSLARTVIHRGARLHEHTRATSIEPGIVRTTRGDVRAPVVVRATEGYTRTLAGMTRDIAPVYSLMLATAPLPSSVWHEIGLAERETFSDARHLIIYGQRTADGRLAFGGRGAPYHFASRIRPDQDRDREVHAQLWRTLVDLFPVLAGHEVDYAWGGPLGIARDWWASCGFDRASGMAWAGGYVGDGVTTSNLAGRTLADLITGRDTELTRLPWVGHRSRLWEPEPFRWIGANLALRAMSGADTAEDRTGRPSRRVRLMSRLTGG
jgi:glycine/D-amino acid oxidase-like deaminating enzyme